MQLKGLVFGVGSILRGEVSGWAYATDDSGNATVPHVYPDHPPLDLSANAYPRAGIDIPAHDAETSDVTKSVFIGTVLMDVTIYAVNSADVYDLLQDSHQAIIDHNDDPAYQTDGSGDPLLENWEFVTDGGISPMLQEDSDKGLTRYSKTVEFEWRHVTAKQTV